MLLKLQLKLAVKYLIGCHIIHALLLLVTTYTDKFVSCYEIDPADCLPNIPDATFRSIKFTLFDFFVIWIVFACMTGNEGRFVSI